jgi:hypothetical protein
LKARAEKGSFVRCVADNLFACFWDQLRELVEYREVKEDNQPRIED